LEHIQFPLDFLLAIRRAIGKGQRTPVFFEVPNVMFTLKDLSIWDLIYEHPSYFSTSSLAHVFVSSGFKVAQLEEAFVGQFLCIYVSPDGDQTDFLNNHWHESKSIQPLVQTFAYRYDCKLKEWKDDLEMKRREGKKAVVWGAGSKGVTFLNVLKTEDSIEYVVDINPRKRGMRVPGTGQEIKPPEFLKEYQPDSIIIMNAIYIEEVHRIVKQINVLADLVTA
jgi:FlaA1/EpsC-like NDP-sugar epimerase